MDIELLELLLGALDPSALDVVLAFAVWRIWKTQQAAVPHHQMAEQARLAAKLSKSFKELDSKIDGLQLDMEGVKTSLEFITGKKMKPTKAGA